MKLTIKAISFKGQPLDIPLSTVFDENGGTIGRASINHFVLADEDKVISNRHGSIQYEGGFYYYVDNSLNGTRILNRNQMIRHDKIMLQDQDQLRIGDYDLLVMISPGAAQAQRPQQSFFSVFARDQLDPGPQRSVETTVKEEKLRDEDSIAYTGDPFLQSQGIESNGDRDYGPAIQESFTPPHAVEAVRPSSNHLPSDLSLEDFFSDEGQSRKSIPEEDSGPIAFFEELRQGRKDDDLSGPGNRDQSNVVTVVSSREADKSSQTGSSLKELHALKDKRVKPLPQASDQLLDVFFKSIGLEDAVDFPRDQVEGILRTAGTVFRELIDGLMTILRGRSELKSQLRVAMTIIKKTENNPLKFSPTVAEAIKILLISKNPGFIGPIEAVREGFEDIQNHQMAVAAGVQASLADILKRFDPDLFEHKFEEGLVLQKKTKCWNEYRQRYPQIIEAAFEEFFGEAFVRAYEDQMDKLRLDGKQRS